MKGLSFLWDDNCGQADAEYILMIFCLAGAVFSLRIFNLVVNKAYLDAINNISKW